MKTDMIAKIIPVVLIVIGGLLLYSLFVEDTSLNMTERLPGNDGTPDKAALSDTAEEFKSWFLKSDGVPSDLPGSWPRFRGANFDAISTENIKLTRTFPGNGPEVLWSLDIGEGYAGAAILAGRVYILDYNHEKIADSLRCLSLDDGREIWRYEYTVKVKRWHGMSRTVPAVTDKYIVTLGPRCHVTCLNPETGDFKWMIDLVKDYKTTVPDWHAGQCPIIDNDKAIIAPGGDVLMMAVDCETGNVLWKTPNPNKWVMTHSSVIPMEFNGKKMYVYCGGNNSKGGVVGVSADDGSILWETTEWKLRTNVPSPLPVSEGRIFLSAGYNEGSMMIQLAEENGGIKVKPLFRLEQKVFGAEQQTPIFYQGYIYGIRLDSQLVCLDLNGNVVWSSTSANKFGKGPYMIADGLIYVMDNSGVLTIAEATSAAFKPLAKAKVLEGIESWGPMALASGRLIVRDLKRMIC
ncbi:MAG: PQQ-binding-like beta-propeller repeat protein, partial [Planctomycetota bacterium]